MQTSGLVIYAGIYNPVSFLQSISFKHFLAIKKTLASTNNMKKKFTLPLFAFIATSFLSQFAVAQLNLNEYRLIRDYNFGSASANTVRSLANLGTNFNPYGVAGTIVINSEWQRYQPFNSTNHVFAANDLELTAVPNLGGVYDGGISSGQITTKETFYPSGGKTYLFQVRAKVPAKRGAWPAFWMYSPGGAGSTTSEIDIFEFFDSPTQNTYDWTGFDHGDGVGSNYHSIMTNEWVWHPGFDFAATYHTYTLVWKEGDIQKWVDNTMVKGTNFVWNGPAPQVLINLAIGGSINNAPNDASFPCKFLVDYFRVYEKNTTAPPPPPPPPSAPNRALNRPSASSSNQSGSTPANAFDGNATSRWSSSYSDPQWIYADLGATYSINRVILRWEAAYARAYQIQTSANGTTWTTIYSTTAGNGSTDDLTVTGTGRYVRMYGTVRATTYGYSLYEFEVYGNASGGGGGGGSVTPSTIEAENYTAMSGVQTETTTDVGGGRNVSWLDNNDWMDYAVNVSAAGTYAVRFRVAGTWSTAQLQLRRGSTVLATVPVPNTGGYQVWTTTAPVNVALQAGAQTLRIYVTSGGFNINKFSFSTTSAAGRAAPAVDVIEEADAKSIGIYPNPAGSVIRVSLQNDHQGPVVLSIINSMGQTVKVLNGIKTNNQFTTDINIAGYTAGMYVVNVQAGKRYIGKIMKK